MIHIYVLTLQVTYSKMEPSYLEVWFLPCDYIYTPIVFEIWKIGAVTYIQMKYLGKTVLLFYLDA